MIKTTHVGSLPFLDIKSALAYTFEWDIPALFTLPMKNKFEFLGNDLIASLGFEPTLNLPRDYFKSRQEIAPHHLVQFLTFGEKIGKLESFKIQFPGPVTLYSMLENQDEIKFHELSEFLLEKYLVSIANLQKYGDILFVLDEPLLRNNILFYEKSATLLQLKETGSDVFVHCCDKIDLAQLENSLGSMHLDIGLYRDSPGFFELPLKFIGLNPAWDWLPTMGGNNFLFKDSLNLISPPCGLGLSKIQEVKGLPQLLQNFFR